MSQVQCRYTDEFHSDNQRRFFIDMALKRGEFYAWFAAGRAAWRPDTEFINDELTYISQYAIHRAKPLEAELAVVGVGEVMDVTTEVLARHQAVLNPEASGNPGNQKAPDQGLLTSSSPLSQARICGK